MSDLTKSEKRTTWYQRGPSAAPSTFYVAGGLSGRLTAIAVQAITVTADYLWRRRKRL
jgi:hypothetical protein